MFNREREVLGKRENTFVIPEYVEKLNEIYYSSNRNMALNGHGLDSTE